jgi:inosine-uridine nucleoside N-ribohydrolase
MRPHFRAFFASFAVVAAVGVSSLAAQPGSNPAPRRVLLDADTANEVDDLFAIVRALIAPSLEVIGLCSAQWQNSHYATRDTLEDSQRLNEMLLALLELRRIPAPRGASGRVYDFGRDRARHSAAASFLIREAQRTPEGAKLDVIVLGAATNVASALLIDPGIVPKLRVHLLGTSREAATGIWRKRDFNCAMDPQAIEVVLDARELETHIMPVNVAAPLVFELGATRERLGGRHELPDILCRRWTEHHDGARLRRTIWDLALVSAFLRPDLARTMAASAPPENGGRPVTVYTSIDAAGMREEFFAAIEAKFARRPQSVRP